MQTNTNNTMETMAELLAAYGDIVQPVRGSLVDGTVIRIDRSGAWVDYHGKSDGLVPASEFGEGLEAGQTIKFFVLDSGNDDTVLTLSAKRAGVWSKMQQARETREIVQVRVSKVAENEHGGIAGVNGRINDAHAFVPLRKLGISPLKAKELVGSTIDCYVLDVDPERHRLVLDHASVLKDRAHEAAKVAEESREVRFAELKVGQKLTGTVVSVEKYGCFVDVGGGLHGLLHHSEHDGSTLTKGAEVEVRVIRAEKTEEGKRMVALRTRKTAAMLRAERKEQFQVTEQARDGRFAELQVGQILTGKVAVIESYGIFVDVGAGLHGLVHNTELGSNKPEVGAELQVRVTRADRNAEGKRMVTLSLRLEPEVAFLDSIKPGDVIDGVVHHKAPYGAFVRISEKERLNGLVHKSQFANGEAELETLADGTAVKVRVLSVDKAARRVSLSMKDADKVA